MKTNIMRKRYSQDTDPISNILTKALGNKSNIGHLEKSVDRDSKRDLKRDHKQRHGNSKSNIKLGLNQKKSIRVTWRTGTERAQEAANNVLSSIFAANPRGDIKIINPETNEIQVTNIKEFARGIDLQHKGFAIVDYEKINASTKLPLIKLIESKLALKRYSDILAKKKDEELRKLGYSRNSSKNDKSNHEGVKHVRITWQITLDDLRKQKAHEITSALKKGVKVNIYIDDKSLMGRPDQNWMIEFEEGIMLSKSPGTIGNNILKMREEKLQTLINILEEYALEPNIIGNTTTRVMLKCIPKPNFTLDTNKRALKEQKRKERLQKLQERTERKLRKQKSLHDVSGNLN